MKYVKLLIITLICGCSLTSCYLFQSMRGPNAEFWDNSMYMPMEKARLFADSLSQRKVLVFPMRYAATPKHLAYFKRYLDLKKEEGYVVFYETIDLRADGENLSDNEADTLRRKYRRVVGEVLGRKIESRNKHIKTEDFRQTYNLRGWVDSLGLITDRDFHVDMSLSQIIADYEANYKPITLLSRDFEIALHDKSYSPSDTVAHAKYYMVWEPRAEYIVDQVITSHYDRVLVVCSEDLMGYMLRPLFNNGYSSLYGFGANEDFKKLSVAE